MAKGLKYPPILEVLKHYGCEAPPSPRLSGWNKMRCPWHDDTRPSAQLNVGEDKFNCFTCNLTETSLGIIMRMEGLNAGAAASRAEELFGTTSDRKPKAPGRRGSLFDGAGNHENGRGEVPSRDSLF